MSRIVLLHDASAALGRPDSADTVLEAGAVRAALEARGHDVVIVPVSLDLSELEQALAAFAPVVAFNLVESLEGRGELIQAVPALLESLAVPYTGCSSLALATTSHKLMAKDALRRAGLPTPAAVESPAGLPGPWIVKSVVEHASLGIDDGSVVADDNALAGVLADRRRRFGGRWFAERFVPGRELNVALICSRSGPHALPVAEIRFRDFPPGKPAIVGYAAKWDPESFEYEHTVRSFDVEASLAERVVPLAEACWGLFGLAGYARVDFRVDADGGLWILEVNANPCLAPDAGFAAALAAAGISYADAINGLVDDALRRGPVGTGAGS